VQVATCGVARGGLGSEDGGGSQPQTASGKFLLEAPEKDSQQQVNGFALPGILQSVLEGGCENDLSAPAQRYNADVVSGEGSPDVQAATVAQVVVEGGENGVEDPLALPVVVAAVAGLPGGKAGRQVVPGGGGAVLPEDGIQDRALVEGRGNWRGKETRQARDFTQLF